MQAFSILNGFGLSQMLDMQFRLRLKAQATAVMMDTSPVFRQCRKQWPSAIHAHV